MTKTANIRSYKVGNCQESCSQVYACQLTSGIEAEAPKILALHFNFSGVGDYQIGYFPHPSLEEATNSLCNLEQVSQPFSASVPPLSSGMITVLDLMRLL